MVPLDVPYTAPGPEEQEFKMIFYRGVLPMVHRVMHYIVVFFGVSSGYTFVIYHLVTNTEGWGKWVLELVLLSISLWPQGPKMGCACF